jgi:uncharacterized protein
MYYDLFLEFKKILGHVNNWLDKTEAFAKEKSFDANTLVTFRLAPDQLAFARQIQIACDTAKLGASRLTGKEAPSNADTEQTFDELRARINGTIAYLAGFTEQDFAASATRSVTQPRWEGKVMTGKDYFIEHVHPNFYFHVSHVYAILRHNGVPVGKKDYLGALSQRLP